MCLGYVSVWSSLRGNWHISPGSAPGHQGPAAACPGRLLGLPLPSTGAVLVWYPKIQCCGAVIFLFSAPSPPFFLILAPAPFLALKVYSHFKMYILCSNLHKKYGIYQRVFIHPGSLQSDFSKVNIYETDNFGFGSATRHKAVSLKMQTGILVVVSDHIPFMQI